MANLRVVPQITQTSFDEVVKENMEEFEMEGEEALEDAIKQFESQGVDLSNIIKRVPGEEEEMHASEKLLEEYKCIIVEDNVDLNKLKEIVTGLETQLKEKAIRLLLANAGAIVPMLSACSKFQEDEKERGAFLLSLRALSALVKEQPDLLGRVQLSCLEEAGGETAKPTPEIETVCGFLAKFPNDAEIQTASLRIARFGCFMHEHNRQAFVACGFIEYCLVAAELHTESKEVVAQAMQGLRAITRDDDPRVPFGKANEHAKQICGEHKGLQRILQILKGCHDSGKSDANTMADIFRTLSQLSTRDEFCKELVHLGCLDYVLPALQTFSTSETVAQQGCSVLRAVAGNDEVKKIIGERGGIDIIIDVMQTQLKAEKVVEQGCAALAALSLKTPTNSTLIAQAGGPHVIVKGMYMHPKAEKLQRQACVSLRNMVVRNQELVDSILGEGAESAINIAMTTHKSCFDEAKAALRDLHCKVELKELWTGQGAGIKS
eukprot:m.16065 g.16065  ORF g.16065 m.16065 type:complete len:492 (+) comp5578_c0_seq1:93-1568(+)